MLSFVRNLRQKLNKTKSGFLGKIAEAVRLRGKVDEELFDEIEDILLKSDTGVEITELILERLREEIRIERITDVEIAQITLTDIMQDVLVREDMDAPDFFAEPEHKPHIIVFVGVNGTGKTTTIGKVAHKFASSGKKVLIVAGDTFRAAAIEQVAIWAERAGVAIVRAQADSDPSAVIYDGINSAIAKGFDIVLIDTAGRQHTKEKLMKELGKIDRTIKKLVPDAPHEAILVVDATTGQNAISQALNFDKSIKLTGLALTKYDGTAKGGIIFNLRHNLKLPVKLLGVGEGMEDLIRFRGVDFVKAFFTKESEENEE